MNYLEITVHHTIHQIQNILLIAYLFRGYFSPMDIAGVMNSKRFEFAECQYVDYV